MLRVQSGGPRLGRALRAGGAAAAGPGEGAAQTWRDPAPRFREKGPARFRAQPRSRGWARDSGQGVPLRLRAGWAGEGDAPPSLPRPAFLLERLCEGEAESPPPARITPKRPLLASPAGVFLHPLRPAGLSISRSRPRSTQSILSGCRSTKVLQGTFCFRLVDLN